MTDEIEIKAGQLWLYSNLHVIYEDEYNLNLIVMCDQDILLVMIHYVAADLLPRPFMIEMEHFKQWITRGNLSLLEGVP